MDSRKWAMIIEALNGFFGDDPDLQHRFWRLLFKMGENLVEAGPELRKIFDNFSDLTERGMLDFMKENRILPRQHHIRDLRSSSSSTVQQARTRRPESATSQNLMAFANYGRGNKNRENNIYNGNTSYRTEPTSNNRRHSDPGRSDYDQGENWSAKVSPSQQEFSQQQRPPRQPPAATSVFESDPHPSRSQRDPTGRWNRRTMNLEDGSETVSGSVPRENGDGQRKHQSTWGTPVGNMQKKVRAENPVSGGGVSQPLNLSNCGSTSGMALYDPAEPLPVPPPYHPSMPNNFRAAAQPPNRNSSSVESVVTMSKHSTVRPQAMQQGSPSASGVRRSKDSFDNRGNETPASNYSSDSSPNEGQVPPRNSVLMKPERVVEPEPTRFNQKRRKGQPKARHELKCPDCQKRFNTHAGHSKHIANQVCRDKPYRCKICRSAYGSKYSLKKHLMQAHGILKKVF